MQKAGETLGVEIKVLRAGAENEFEVAFQSISQLQVSAIVIDNDGLFISHSEGLAALSVSHSVPAIFQFRKFSAAGGLISYGSSFTDPYRKLGMYAGRVLKGENPAELPVEQSTKVELIINLKTAKRLGLTIPLPLLGRADEVIE
jgi:putative ABC transport system substrate-binding protein